MSDEIMRSLGRIEGELVTIRQLSTRVSALEKWQSRITGAMSLLGLLWTAAFGYFLKGSSSHGG